jgi:hypothetical protein
MAPVADIPIRSRHEVAFMRVGGSSTTHHAGMSSLWHDPDFQPVRQFEAPLVQKNFDDLPVPTERHELPDGVEDPFQKLEAVYDAAAVQMERGLKGAEFLHGKKVAATPEGAVMAGPDDATRIRERPTDPARQQATTLDRQTRDHQRRLDQAAHTQTVKASSSTKTSADKEVEHATNAGATGNDGKGAVEALMTFGPMVAAQAASATVQGPLATASTQALQMVNTITAASEVALAGISEGVSVDVDAPTGPRRGLAKKG